MKIVHYLRFRGFVATALLFLLLAPALAIDSDNPVNMVLSIYKLYGDKGKGLSLQDPVATSVLSDELFKLVQADVAQAEGEAGFLDFDPFCACQDFDISGVKPHVISRALDSTRLQVKFLNFGKLQTVELSMVKTAAGWRVADIRTKLVPSLRDYLVKALSKKGE